MAITPNNCDLNLTAEDMERLSWGIGNDGYPIQRMVLVTEAAGNPNYFDCDRASEPLDRRMLYGLDSNNNWALRVTIDGL